MELVSHLTCPCRPGVLYKHEESLKAHRKTKVHAAWIMVQENRQDKAFAKSLENENQRLRNKLEHKEKIEAELLYRINCLEQEVEYWKIKYNER